jgi:ATP-dependent NAD(P)H-hydrate dehydratase
MILNRRANLVLGFACITTPLRYFAMIATKDVPRSSSEAAVSRVQSLNGKTAAVKICKNLVPPLDSSSYKGQMGRIGVIGGSPDYSGAPYYAAESALKFGADLSFVFCAKQAAIPIKSYSPELMVTPFYDMDAISSLSLSPSPSPATGRPSDDAKEKMIQDLVGGVVEFFPRLHSLVIGPGLGRDSYVLRVVAGVIRKAREADLP